MKRKAKRDLNEKEIVAALRKMGATVEFLDLTNGPDILVGHHGKNYLFEVKQPGKELRQEQLEWKIAWYGRCNTVHTIEEALLFMGASGAR